MINNAEFIKSDVIKVVSMGEDEDVIKFASDLRDSLDGFQLIEINSSSRYLKFTCNSNDFREDTTTERYLEWRLYFDDKVLIKNRKIAMNNCKTLINNQILNLK